MAAFCLRVLLLWAGILVVTNCEYSLLFDTKSDAERGAVTMFLISLHFPFYKVIYSIIWGKMYSIFKAGFAKYRIWKILVICHIFRGRLKMKV